MIDKQVLYTVIKRPGEINTYRCILCGKEEENLDEIKDHLKKCEERYRSSK
jgi:hypothetical protein